MALSRRFFLQRAAGAAACAPWIGLPSTLNADSWLQDTPPKKLKILVLGGTKFLGPAIVDEAVRRGHEVTLFNRGRTNPHLYPKLEKLKGDRNGKIDALKGRKFDAVIDTSAYYPRQVKLTAEALSTSTHYVFISSISVYPDLSKDTSEKTPVGTIEDPTIEKVTGRTYGPLKALCEQAAEKAMPGRVANVRPGLIVGRGDPTDRFTYWPARIAKGGRVLAPENPKWGVQYIDVRDLGEWVIRICEKKTAGVFNALGPNQPTPIGDLLKKCKEVSKSDAEFVWADLKFLKEHGVHCWGHLPVITPPAPGMDRPAICDNSAAVKAGLTFRTLTDTVTDTLKFHLSRGDDYKLTWGLKPEKEKEVLAAWDAQTKAKKKEEKSTEGAK